MRLVGDHLRASLFLAVKGIIAEPLGIDPDRITLKADFVKDLGADSLDLVELVMEFEDPFDIRIPDEDAQQLRTAEDVVLYLVEKVPPEKLESWLMEQTQGADVPSGEEAASEAPAS